MISENSQLALRMTRPETMSEQTLEDMKLKILHHDLIMANVKEQHRLITKVVDENAKVVGEEGKFEIEVDSLEEGDNVQMSVRMMFAERDIEEKLGGTTKKLIKDMNSDWSDTKFFFICNSVYEASALIKVGAGGFTARIMKDLKDGKYTYLLGKHQMARFIITKRCLHGMFFDSEAKRAFEYSMDLETGDYFYHIGYDKEFSTLVRIMTFVELGDIEVVVLPPGRNNGGKKNVNKVTNTSPNTVYVVDSSWNKLIIRDEEFKVRGHFRLQPCGPGFVDRKLIWISSFTKEGYTRQPKAQIIK